MVMLWVGIMEMSHRDAGGPVQRSIIRAEELFRQLLSIPDDYHVLFFQGITYHTYNIENWSK
jgi:phosphoserine aminotransferase